MSNVLAGFGNEDLTKLSVMAAANVKGNGRRNDATTSAVIDEMERLAVNGTKIKPVANPDKTDKTVQRLANAALATLTQNPKPPADHIPSPVETSAFSANSPDTRVTPPPSGPNNSASPETARLQKHITVLQADILTVTQQLDTALAANRSLQVALAQAHAQIASLEARERERATQQEALERRAQEAALTAATNTPRTASASLSPANFAATRFFIETLAARLHMPQRRELDATLAREWNIPAGVINESGVLTATPDQVGSLGKLVATLMGSLPNRSANNRPTLKQAIASIKKDTFDLTRGMDELSYPAQSRLGELAGLIAEHWNDPLRRGASQAPLATADTWARRHIINGAGKENARA